MTDIIKLCSTCKYFHHPQHIDPCKTCQSGQPSNTYKLWEAK